LSWAQKNRENENQSRIEQKQKIQNFVECNCINCTSIYYRCIFCVFLRLTADRSKAWRDVWKPRVHWENQCKPCNLDKNKINIIHRTQTHYLYIFLTVYEISKFFWWKRNNLQTFCNRKMERKKKEIKWNNTLKRIKKLDILEIY
jgi:hypothetical protein